MVGTLIESRATAQRRTGSSIASAVLHVAMIGAAVGMTAREAVTEVHRVPEIPVVTFPPAPPLQTPPPAHPQTSATTSVAAVPSAPVLRTPLIVPTEIAAPDWNPAPMPTFPGDRRVATTGLFCGRDCPRTGGTVDGSGRDSWTANDIMMRLRDDPVPPRYPEVLRRAGIEGSVTVRFVVDTTGRVEMSSIVVLQSTHEAFVIAARESLAKLRFNPSRIGDRRVPAVAVMPFQFTLTPRGH